MDIAGEVLLQTNYVIQNDSTLIFQLATAYDEEGLAELDEIITSTDLK